MELRFPDLVTEVRADRSGVMLADRREARRAASAHAGTLTHLRAESTVVNCGLRGPGGLAAVLLNTPVAGLVAAVAHLGAYTNPIALLAVVLVFSRQA